MRLRSIFAVALVAVSAPAFSGAHTLCYPFIPLYRPEFEKFTTFDGLPIGGSLSAKDITDKFGRTNMVQSGDAGDYKSEICYKSSRDDTGIAFIGGELGIDTLLIEANYRNLPHWRACGRSARFDRHLKIASLVSLGMTVYDLSRIGAINQIGDSKYEMAVSTKQMAPNWAARIRKANHGDDVYQGAALGDLISQSLVFSFARSHVTGIRITRQDHGIYLGDCVTAR